MFTSTAPAHSSALNAVHLQTRCSLIINVISLCTASWGLYKATRIILPANLSNAGHKQFLTNISVVATIVSNIASIHNYFIQRTTHDDCSHANPCRRKVRANFISRQIILPVALVLETIVPVVYWPLRLFFINLILQGVKDSSRSPIPIPVDLAIHFFPFVALFSDHYLSGSDGKFILPNKIAWVIVTVLGFTYNRWLDFLIDTSSGASNPYPFLDIREPIRSVIFVFVTTLGWGFYVLYQRFPPTPRITYSRATKKL